MWKMRNKKFIIINNNILSLLILRSKPQQTHTLQLRRILSAAQYSVMLLRIQQGRLQRQQNKSGRYYIVIGCFRFRVFSSVDEYNWQNRRFSFSIICDVIDEDKWGRQTNWTVITRISLVLGSVLVQVGPFGFSMVGTWQVVGRQTESKIQNYVIDYLEFRK